MVDIMLLYHFFPHCLAVQFVQFVCSCCKPGGMVSMFSCWSEPLQHFRIKLYEMRREKEGGKIGWEGGVKKRKIRKTDSYSLVDSNNNFLLTAESVSNENKFCWLLFSFGGAVSDKGCRGQMLCWAPLVYSLGEDSRFPSNSGGYTQCILRQNPIYNTQHLNWTIFVPCLYFRILTTKCTMRLTGIQITAVKMSTAPTMFSNINWTVV